MKAQDNIVYRIITRSTGEAVEAYSRGDDNGYGFSSPEKARDANVHGVFQDKEKYQINKYRVVYQLIQYDVDGEGIQGWVNPTDRMPQYVTEDCGNGRETDCVKIELADGRQAKAWYQSQEGWENMEEKFDEDEVIAWRYLE
jgi:hypothetical protein